MSYFIRNQKAKRNFKIVRSTEPSASQIQNAQRDSWSWAKLCAAIFSGASVTLVLLGYGVAMAVEARFGIARASLYAGASDLLELSVIAIDMLMRNVATPWDKFLWKVIFQSFPTVAWMLSVWAALAVVLWFSSSRQTSSKKGLIWLKLLKNKIHVRSEYFKRHLLLGAVIVMSPLMAWVLVMGALIVLFVPVLLVAMGMTAGLGYINKDVLEPRRCAVLLPVMKSGEVHHQEQKAQTSMPETYARCMALEDEQGKELARGRLVLASPRAVVLMFEDKQAKRFDLSQKVIKQVDTLIK